MLSILHLINECHLILTLNLNLMSVDTLSLIIDQEKTERKNPVIN